MSRSRSGTHSSSRSRSGSRPRRRNEKARSPRSGENPCRIWVGGLDDRINEKEVQEEFGSFGEVVDVKVRSTPRDTFAFVEFASHTAAKRAIDDMNQAKIRGSRVKVNWASFKDRAERGGNRPYSSGSSRSSRYQIWVGRLHEDTREETVRKKFAKFGEIVSMQLRTTSQDVFCFVEYKSPRSCEDAIAAMNQKDFDGSRIVVDWSKRNQEEMNRGGRGRRRRSRSYEVRSRSRSRGRNPPPKGKYKCELENLPPEMTWMDLKNLARKMRGGNSITFARTFEQNRVPCGLLEFESRGAMEDLIKDLDGKRINGRKIRINTI